MEAVDLSNADISSVSFVHFECGRHFFSGSSLHMAYYRTPWYTQFTGSSPSFLWKSVWLVRLVQNKTIVHSRCCNFKYLYKLPSYVWLCAMLCTQVYVITWAGVQYRLCCTRDWCWHEGEARGSTSTWGQHKRYCASGHVITYLLRMRDTAVYKAHPSYERTQWKTVNRQAVAARKDAF